MIWSISSLEREESEGHILVEKKATTIARLAEKRLMVSWRDLV